MMLHIVTQYLRKSAELYPEHPVLVDNKVTLSYSVALEESEKIAAILSSKGLFKKPIAVMMEKGARTVTVFCGVALSGNY